MRLRPLLSTLKFVLILSTLTAHSQDIEIGQDAEFVKQFVEYSTKNHRKPDHFGNRANSYWTCDTKYYNGEITEVYQCYQNQLLYDFGIKANYCKRFIMEKDKLSYVLTQFENVSFNQLKQNYATLHSENKIGDFYFFDSFKHYSKIYLSKNGLATIEMRKTDISKLPKKVQQTINLRLKNLYDSGLDNQKSNYPNEMVSKRPQINNDSLNDEQIKIIFFTGKFEKMIKKTFSKCGNEKKRISLNIFNLGEGDSEADVTGYCIDGEDYATITHVKLMTENLYNQNFFIFRHYYFQGILRLIFRTYGLDFSVDETEEQFSYNNDDKSMLKFKLWNYNNLRNAKIELYFNDKFNRDLITITENSDNSFTVHTTL
ncbi:hypothetical protein LZZ90_00555 [Flavobacterium sp. SM15]|uniref:hypothetical protein n=1 Tax=Flavobacterium sp. SM15 TaxID=2908005 RepID=UPI001EDB6A97|nr:hypothetical protein [Flavobacterium sp. SM15]MCG2609992.1 hypothetical protein [Flavobacterium sp. SM15]